MEHIYDMFVRNNKQTREFDITIDADIFNDKEKDILIAALEHEKEIHTFDDFIECISNIKRELV